MSGRSRRRSRRVLPVVVLLTAVLLVGAAVLPAASYSTGDVDRGAGVDVVNDQEASLSLDTAANVSVGTVDQLVVVTNGFESTATVSVSLTSASPANASLVVGGASVGDAYSTDLGPGASLTVDVDVPDDDSLDGSEIVFDAAAETGDIDATASGRRVPIEGTAT
ncbi:MULTISPECIES: hypothetical protein [Halolamina]|uniref:Uncharacterized protein n=1 Tax=Halolamina pelagica TaxID=699431 RepID=A0A1I5TQU8_9EURY|nr:MULTISPECIES: hypothetical protein [Halolamina]NHX37771.1 hypothetical protein [Halolamina sp. R1-12]SFP85403.1 hypothetical protein SAMN05216277_11052 [Halolamina pelagica]